MKNKYLRWFSFGVLFSLLFALTGCAVVDAFYKAQEKAFYQKKENFTEAEGTITYLEYDEKKIGLYFHFSDLSVPFDNGAFKLEGENLRLFEARGGAEKIQVGDRIKFFSANRIFGDGYIMPIVGVEFDGEVFLTFDEGYANLMERYK